MAQRTEHSSLHSRYVSANDVTFSYEHTRLLVEDVEEV